ncbi:MAG: TrkA family potassium uptake protein [Mycoplasma sp.]|nr:TrkA family potassium uptake protein [Mycoplasma sp.]
MSKSKNQICVIGVGRFGTSVIMQLTKLNKKVLAIDIDEKSLQNVSRYVDTIVADGLDVNSMKALGINLFDTVIISTPNNIEIAATLIELGINKIIAKANNDTQERILRYLGVNMISRPELEAGKRIANIVSNEAFIKYSKDLQEIGTDYSIGSSEVLNRKWINVNLANLPFKKYNSLVVAIKRNQEIFLPDGNFKLKSNDIITIVGKTNQIVLLFTELNKGSKANELEKKQLIKRKSLLEE